MSTYPGIDYGLGQSNCDHKEGIRYGVISANSLPYWWDEAEADYGNPHCPGCGNEVEEGEESDFYCQECQLELDSDQVYGDTPLYYYYKEEGYEATQSGDDTDIFLVKSPYYTHAQFCSPCAPGAGHLENPCRDGPKTYCWGPEWFEGEPPYPIYKVADKPTKILTSMPSGW